MIQKSSLLLFLILVASSILWFINIRRSQEKTALNLTKPSAPQQSSRLTSKKLPTVYPREPATTSRSSAKVSELSENQKEAARKVAAQMKNKPKASRKKRKQLILNERGKGALNFSQHSKSYEFLNNTYAVGKNQFPRDKGYIFLEKKLGMIFFQIPEGSLPPPDAIPVVVSDSNLRLGIATGIFKVKLRENTDAQQLAEDFSLVLIRTIPQIGLSLLKGNQDNPGLLVEQLNSLRLDPRVLSADIQITDNTYKPH